MSYGKLIATIQMVLCFLASVGYLFDGDYRKAGYWFCAGVLTCMVTY